MLTEREKALIHFVAAQVMWATQETCVSTIESKLEEEGDLRETLNSLKMIGNVQYKARALFADGLTTVDATGFAVIETNMEIQKAAMKMIEEAHKEEG